MGLAMFLAGLLILGGALAASPSLHKAFHQEAGSESHQCVICKLAQGQISAGAPAPVVVMVCGSLILPRLVRERVLYLSVDRRIWFGRGPPSACCLSAS